jgi:hypothetical protein
VLVIVVDQMRADYLTRFRSRFGEGGFRSFTDHGAYWPFARYEVLQGMTGPGHATVLTGSYPYRSGISLNAWCTTDAKGRTRSMYVVQDETAPLVGGNPPPGFNEEGACDAATDPGVSPRRLVGSTVGDELKLAGHPSRVVALALKDRAAVLLGGHLADLALWFDPVQFHWISSRYYVSDLPEWVARLNARLDARHDERVTFASEGPGTGLTAGTFGMDLPFGDKGALKLPLGVALTVDAAIEAIDALGLGKGRDTDLLAISISSHDTLGHDLGPNRREMEELTVAEDREIARLLTAVASRLPGGLDDALLALTADHGIPSPPAYMQGLRKDFAGYIDAVAVRKRADDALRARFGPPAGANWVTGTVDLNFWLNDASVAAKPLDRDHVSEALRAEIRRLVPEAEFVLTRGDIAARRIPGGALGEHILRGYRDGQGGDVVVIPRPFFAAAGDVTAHMTDYAYDMTVPLAIVGRGVEPRVYSSAAAVNDLAPTLSWLLGIVPPALNEGRVLSEALR